MGADGCRGALFELDKHKIFESEAFLFVLDGRVRRTRADLCPQGAKRYAEAFRGASDRVPRGVLGFGAHKCGKPRCSKDRDGAGHGPYRYPYYANRL